MSDEIVGKPPIPAAVSDQPEISQPQEIRQAKREVTYAVQVLDTTIARFEDLMTYQLGQFEQKLIKLEEENFILKKLPSLIEVSLERLGPAISAKLQQQISQELETALLACDRQINTLAEKVRLTLQQVDDSQNRQLKKRLQSMIMAITISICASSTFTYYLIRHFPKIVHVDTKGDVRIEGGNTSVWGKRYIATKYHFNISEYPAKSLHQCHIPPHISALLIHLTNLSQLPRFYN